MRRVVALTLITLSGGLAGHAMAQQPGPAAPAATPAESPAPAAPDEVAQKCNEACVRANADKASAICARQIEAQAPGDFEWITRPFTGIFQQADPSKGDEPTATYRGDFIRFMSPQKEWVRVSYECAFDVERNTVAAIRVRPGRIDRPVALQGPPPASPGAAGPQPEVKAPALAAAIMQAAKQRAGTAQPQQAAAPVNLRTRIGERSAIDIIQVNPRRGYW